MPVRESGATFAIRLCGGTAGALGLFAFTLHGQWMLAGCYALLIAAQGRWRV